MISLGRFKNLISAVVVACALTVSIGAVDAFAQASNGTNVCPTAERLEREKVLLELNCDYRQNVVATLEGQVPEVEDLVDQDGITARQSRIYANEVRVLNNRIKVAQRSANIACRAVDLRQGTIDRAQSTCDASAPVE